MKNKRTGSARESVWDYPRPPGLEAATRRVRVEFGGVTVADSTAAYRLLETSHPPVYYIPKRDIELSYLQAGSGSSFCEWKGRAVYYDLEVADRRAKRAAWEYPDLPDAYRAIADHLAFYPALMDACYLDDERVRPQEGRFYGGWITADIEGPFKGAPGTGGW